jgi:hypothetical protein
MPVRSAAQVHLYFVLFLAFWKLDWLWKAVVGSVAVLMAVYYLPWPFDASHGALWVDALFSAGCALVSSLLIPSEREGKPCKLCYFFCLLAIPAGVLGYASVYIPQTNFPLGVYLAAMVAAGLCTVQAIACPGALTHYVLLPGSAFVWAMIAPNIRFLPVSLALGACVAVFAFREESLQRHKVNKQQEFRGGHWAFYADTREETAERPEPVEPEKQEPCIRKRGGMRDEDIELKLEF